VREERFRDRHVGGRHNRPAAIEQRDDGAFRDVARLEQAIERDDVELGGDGTGEVPVRVSKRQHGRHDRPLQDRVPSLSAEHETGRGHRRLEERRPRRRTILGFRQGRTNVASARIQAGQIRNVAAARESDAEGIVATGRHSPDLVESRNGLNQPLDRGQRRVLVGGGVARGLYQALVDIGRVNSRALNALNDARCSDRQQRQREIEK
jgi:hypothetical protein